MGSTLYLQTRRRLHPCSPFVSQLRKIRNLVNYQHFKFYYGTVRNSGAFLHFDNEVVWNNRYPQRMEPNQILKNKPSSTAGDYRENIVQFNFPSVQ